MIPALGHALPHADLERYNTTSKSRCSNRSLYRPSFIKTNERLDERFGFQAFSLHSVSYSIHLKSWYLFAALSGSLHAIACIKIVHASSTAFWGYCSSGGKSNKGKTPSLLCRVGQQEKPQCRRSRPKRRAIAHMAIGAVSPNLRQRRNHRRCHPPPRRLLHHRHCHRLRRRPCLGQEFLGRLESWQARWRRRLKTSCRRQQ